MEELKELVRRHWDRRSTDFDLEASHGLITDAQALACPYKHPRRHIDAGYAMA